MALDYSNLFAMLGELVEAGNYMQTLYSALDGYEDEVEADYATAGRYDLVAPIPAMFAGFKNGVTGWIGQLNAQAAALLVDKTLVRDETLIGSGTSLQEVCKALFDQMVADGQDVLKSTVTIGSVSTNSVNAGAGTVLTTKVLDGYNSPAAGLQAHVGYAGLNSELSFNDTITLQCISDSEGTGSVSEGYETFRWIGKPPGGDQFGWVAPGTGSGKTVEVQNGFAYFANLEFETWSTNTPGSWTITDGTAGTHIFQDASTPKRGSAALKLTGDGSQATIGLSQSFANGMTPNPSRMYCLSAWVKGQGSTLAGTLTIKLTGTGYTAASSEKIEMDYTALSAQTSWGLENFFIVMPKEIPDDFKLVISVTGTLTSGKSVFVDGVTFGPVTYENGIGVAIVAGAAKYLKGDKHVFTIANDDAGKFQTWFRKFVGMQMPSDASPSISDSLAS